MNRSDGFSVIPAVDVKDGKVVQLVGGERGTGRIYGDPVEAATRWVHAGAETLHLVDLDGAFDGVRRNASAVEQIYKEVDVDLQLGGGIRSIRDATALLESGIDRVILGTAAMEQPSIVAEIEEIHSGTVMVSLDSRGGNVVVEGWTTDTGIDPVTAAVRFEEFGASGILFTNVDVEGKLEGVRVEPITELVEAVDIPVVASGGVSTIDDILDLVDAGADGAVIGTALYEGRFTLQEAITAAHESS